jgi:hypothetical protein
MTLFAAGSARRVPAVQDVNDRKYGSTRAAMEAQ